MKYRFFWMIITILFACSLFIKAQDKETIVLIDTNKGKIKVKLYNDTPKHRDNFIKNVENKIYDGLLFHRVIRQFMIQGGDINSKDAPAKELLGSGDLGYTIPAEIVYPKYFHKAGALCAARTGNDVNPQKESSATQFYIVTGKYFTSMELDKMEKKDNIKFTPEQREAYMMQDGYPQLDQEYTVFGEVISGMKVVNKIQMVETDENDRPIEDIRIKSMKIVKNK